MNTPRLLKSTVVAGLLLFLVPVQSLACRCREPQTGTAYRRAAMIVLAEAIDVRARPGIQGQELKLRVLSVWKSDSPEILTVVTGSDCAYAVKQGEKHLLFLIPSENGAFSTGKCMGDAPVGAARRSLSWFARHAKVGSVTRQPTP